MSQNSIFVFLSIQHFLCSLHTVTRKVMMSISVMFLARAETTACVMSVSCTLVVRFDVKDRDLVHCS